MHYLNPAFDPVILKVNANPDPADIGGVSATYPANKPRGGGEGAGSWGLVSSVDKIADLCQC